MLAAFSLDVPVIRNSACFYVLFKTKLNLIKKLQYWLWYKLKFEYISMVALILFFFKFIFHLAFSYIVMHFSKKQRLI